MAIKINTNLAKIAKELLELDYMDEEGYRMFFAKYKLEYIAQGGTRVVAKLNNDYVVKFAKSRYCLATNKAEYQKYKNLDENKRKHYTEIFRHGRDYSYLVAERVIPNIGENQEVVPTEVYELKLMHDYCYFNFGRRENGEWVSLDFAS